MRDQSKRLDFQWGDRQNFARVYKFVGITINLTWQVWAES